MERHQELLDLAEELQELYKPVLFVQFLITGLLLCLVTVQIFIAEKLFNYWLVYVIPFTTVVMTQLFLFCYGGQMLNDASSSVGKSFYDLDKDFLIIMTRALQPSKISDWFYTANLPVFAAIVNSAYSYISILQSLAANSEK